MKQYIEKLPKVLNGKPVIVGTRVPVSRILFLLADEYTLENIHDMYPFISLDVLRGVIQELQTQIDHNKYAS